MLRAEHTFTFTQAITYVETQVIDRLVALAKQEEKTEAEAAEVAMLADLIPTVTQARITVAQCNGLADAKYASLSRDARDFFTEQTGITLPQPDGIDDDADLVLNFAFKAAAAIAATIRFETRETKPIITPTGMEFDDSEPWTVTKIPPEYSTVAGWVLNCPGVLQEAWTFRAYDANPDLWRRRDDAISKNFGAVSVNRSRMH